MANRDAYCIVVREFGRVKAPLPFLFSFDGPVIHIGKTIRRLRKDRSISQQELARLAGLTPSFLSLVENDRRRPSLSVIKRISDALGVPEDLLIWDAVEIPSRLSKHDRHICEMAKKVVQLLYDDATLPPFKVKRGR